MNTWTPTSESLPPDETPVLIMLNGTLRIGEIRWDHPGFEDAYQSYRYWDDPNNDGQCWDVSDVTHWMLVPPAPAVPSVQELNGAEAEQAWAEASRPGAL